ncbi:hypothetical protein [Sphingobium sp. CECT 9361]|uniref:hypothetical protein n=1 Tax=Sphingobium sp. CECT 9361 TaxID=2845384 RepID=UPI001E485689|nr:hypothetical protein [Sphingobium sp. CECT 9361]CAH0355331.1 hypothetical protein SPH9361_03408 [Sphingobium sp. CECT 9361]
MTDTGYTCSTCGAPRTNHPRRTTTLCQACSRKANGSNPSRIAKSRAIMKAHFADPVFKAQNLAKAHDGLRRMLAANPERLAVLREQARALGLGKVGHAAMPKGSEPRRRAVASRLRNYYQWCPIEYRDDYKRLIYSKGLNAADARAIIERQIQVDMEKFHVTGQLQQSVRAGA